MRAADWALMMVGTLDGTLAVAKECNLVDEMVDTMAETMAVTTVVTTVHWLV
jgi:hypothetical protein